MRRTTHISYRITRRNIWSLCRYRYRRFLRRKDTIIDIMGGSLRDRLLGRNFGSQIDVKAIPVGDMKESGTTQSKRWCLFATYSPSSIVTDMVFSQLHSYAEAGFSVVFVSMSKYITQSDRERLSLVCTHIIHRRSFGRDFGAWAHAVRLLADEIRSAETLLLTNDSNLGPFVPLRPWIDRCMEREGMFGLTESIGGGSHLQSYFLVCHGRHTIDAMLLFLDRLRLSHSKWLTVQRGEIRLTRFMRTSGHYTGAIIDYNSLEDAFLNKPELWAELEVVFPNLFKGLRDSNIPRDKMYNRYLLRSRLFLLPLNPSLHFSLVLMKCFQFPFVKAEIVMNNPAMMPSAPDWRYFINEKSPVTEEMIEDHIATLRR